MSDDEAHRVAADELRSLIDRIERLESEKRDIADGIKEVYAEAKGRGYDTAAMRKVIARRMRDRDEVSAEDALIDLYEDTLDD